MFNDPTQPGIPGPAPGPVVPVGGPPMVPPQGGPGQSILTPQETAILDAAFTPEVMRILIKVYPPAAEMLRPFLEAADQQQAQQQQPLPILGPVGGPGPAPVPQSGLFGVGR